MEIQADNGTFIRAIIYSTYFIKSGITLVLSENPVWDVLGFGCFC